MGLVHLQVTETSLDINLDHLDGNVFVISSLIPTHSHLNVVRGVMWKLSVEPWNVVACILAPQWVANITEIVISQKGWRRYRFVARAVVCTYKCPDVLSWVPVSQTNSTHVKIAYVCVGSM